MDDNALVQVQNLKKHFLTRDSGFFKKAGVVHAVDGVSMSVTKGETLGLVGESGVVKHFRKTHLAAFGAYIGKSILQGQASMILTENNYGECAEKCRLYSRIPMHH